MKKAVLCGAAVVVALCGLCLLLTGTSEPAYKGTKISRWIGVANRAELETGLAQLGPEAIPYLIDALEKQDTPWARTWSRLWIRLPAGVKRHLAKWRPVSAGEIRRNAIAGLWGFGPEARSALPCLMRMAVRDQDAMVRSFARVVAGDIGGDLADVQDFFLRELQNTNRILRSQVADAIYISDLKLVAAVPLLMRDLSDRKEKPYNEFLALSVIGAEAKDTVPFIAAQMDDPAIQGNALTALIGIGQGLKPAVPTLIHLLQGTNEGLRPAAADALMVAGPDAVAALPVLTEAQQDMNPVVRVLATAAIGRIKRTPETAVAALMQELRNKSPNLTFQPWSIRHRLEGPYALRGLALSHRQAAAWLLGDIGPQAKAAVPLLKEAMNSGDSWLRPIAARAVYKITGEANTALPTLLTSLSDQSNDVCFLALQALGEMGTNAAPAVGALLKLKIRNLNIRRAVMQARNKIDPGRGR